MRFEEDFDMVRKGGQSSIILKRDVKYAFQNIFLAPHIPIAHIRWLYEGYLHKILAIRRPHFQAFGIRFLSPKRGITFEKTNRQGRTYGSGLLRAQL